MMVGNRYTNNVDDVPVRDDQGTPSSLNSNCTTMTDAPIDDSDKSGGHDGKKSSDVNVLIERFKEEINDQKETINALREALNSERRGFGRNNLNKNSWDNNDMLNEKTLNAYIRQKLFHKKKFLEKDWDRWAPKEGRSLSHKLVTKNDALLKLPPKEEWEWYWRKRIVAIVNKKYVELRSNANSNHKSQYMSKEGCRSNFNFNQAV